MERFEAENGTIVSASFFMGPFATLPAALYIIIERCFFRSDTAIFGTSLWVFLLLSIEAIKVYRANPFFSLGDWKIPTWTSPLILILLIYIFIPGTSLLGHLCGCAVGYAYGLGYLKILAPPEKVLRFIEGKLNLLGRVPHYVSVDQKTYGRYGVLPSSVNRATNTETGTGAREWTGGSGRLGP
ncbi:putative rhomboid protein 2 [Phaeomoniella chlamydospora]|uniref:Putative rhomboid protein 2 n=1 Tax=Phaeomoniella chlamydospora TaxID=158046 RepID=A0A0G2EAA6_PHACM|nr:putative rhomboid protein 2 [Phaeomoniella chlamydospora]